jgi:hypothetical protein
LLLGCNVFFNLVVDNRQWNVSRTTNPVFNIVICTFHPIIRVDTGDSHSKDVLSKLSIPYENANLNMPVSDDLLRELFIKADNILQSPSSVVKAPGFEGLFVRHSPKEENIEPHC